MIELLIITWLVMIIAFSLSYFLTNKMPEVHHFASAGQSPSDRTKAVVVAVAKKFMQKSKGLKLVQIEGNSASKVGIKTDDIVAIDETIKIDTLQTGDIIYLEYQNHPGKFKIREFDKVNGDYIFSKTLRNQEMISSKHQKSTFKGVAKYHAIAA